MNKSSILATMNKYAALLKTMDVIWSKVRGVEGGVLPTDQDKIQLKDAIMKITIA